MDKLVFDPRNKIFEFKLDKYSCHRCLSGVCSLDKVSIDEIKAHKEMGHVGESHIKYCIGMAKMFLDDEFKSPALIYYNERCNHYSFGDGQHRTCVVSNLLRRGEKVTLYANFSSQDCMCRNCLVEKKHSEKEQSLNFFDKLFKNRKYNQLKESINGFRESEFIRHL